MPAGELHCWLRAVQWAEHHTTGRELHVPQPIRAHHPVEMCTTLPDNFAHTTGESDNNVQTAQLEQTLIKIILKMGPQRFISNVAELREVVDWSSSPRHAVEQICKLEVFYTEIFKLYRNGVLPRQRLQDALVNIDSYVTDDDIRPHRWHFTDRPTRDLALSLIHI